LIIDDSSANRRIVRVLTLVAIASPLVLVAALVHAHEKHTAHPLSPALLDVEGV
jgi:hypothetical protein